MTEDTFTNYKLIEISTGESVYSVSLNDYYSNHDKMLKNKFKQLQKERRYREDQYEWREI